MAQAIASNSGVTMPLPPRRRLSPAQRKNEIMAGSSSGSVYTSKSSVQQKIWSVIPGESVRILVFRSVYKVDR